jgi:protein phosphatase
MRIEVAGTSHVGMKRNHNEDSYLVMPDQCLFCVADGMGGHSAGEVASRIAVDELAEFFKMTSRDEEMTWPYKMDKKHTYEENRLATGIKLANRRIFERQSSDAKYRGMGTTIVTLYFTGSSALVGHVGDSRVYLFRRGALRQITEDHSLVNDYMKQRKLSAQEIESFREKYKNVIIRALGMKDTVQVDLGKLEPQDGDMFLLCSDGLSTMIPDDQIQGALQQNQDLNAAATRLIDLANAAGGADNVTCVLARYHLS